MASSSGAPIIEEDAIVEPGVEPGASAETMLLTEARISFDEFETITPAIIPDIQADPPKTPSDTDLEKSASLDNSDMVRINIVVFSLFLLLHIYILAILLLMVFVCV